MNAPVKIVVVQQGWVLIGREADATTLEDAKVIRRWGTTMGLGELALCGPTKNTVSEPCGKVTLNPSAVLYRLHVGGEAEARWGY